MKERFCGLVARHQGLMEDAAAFIWSHPETGYREWKTNAYLMERFEALGYVLQKAGNIPGFYTQVDTGRPGPCLAILGEMDAVICRNHPASDPVTGAVHACGHHAQCATLLGIAASLKEPGALDELCGSIRLMAVPAEELLELGFREELRKQGIIRYFGGKVEFIHRGYFDQVDMAVMIHGGGLREGKYLRINPGNNGCVVKNIRFHGLASHAGGAPQNGVNALYAATTAINAVNALRETFTDHDHIRFHPIMTEGGLAVNVIPERVCLESYVRGASYDAIVKYNQKINRALAGSAAAMGCRLELSDMPGYFPLHNEDGMQKAVAEAMRLVAGPDAVEESDSWGTGCTDMGDVAAIMPATHPHCSGSKGNGHGADYEVIDSDLAYVKPAQCLLVMAGLLLKEEALRARKILEAATPLFASKEAYLEAIDALMIQKDVVHYHEDGTVTLDWRR